MVDQPEKDRSDDAVGGADHPGQRLGLPSSGPGSLARWLPRIGALALDWLVANLAAYAVVRDSAMWQAPVTAIDFVPLLVFAIEVWVLTALLGASMGHRVAGLRVARLDGRPVGFVRALVRTGLLLLVIPVIIIDADGRGLHDRLAQTVLIRTR